MDITENKGCFENEVFEEDAILESLFVGCDTEGTGLVNVSKLVEYLSLTVTGDNVDFGGNFNDLTHLLDPNGKDVAVDIKTYRAGMKNWIEGIRNDSFCEDVHEGSNCSPIKYEFNDVTNQLISPNFNKTHGSAKNYSSESVEGVGGESPQKQEWDLIAKIEDLQLTNKRISEHNTELSAQMENTEETNSYLLQELSELQKIIRSYQCLEEKKKNLEKENEELRLKVSDLQETSKNYQNKAKQLEKEKSGLTEALEEVKNKFAMVNRRLDNLSKDHKNVCNAYNEEKQKLVELEELKMEKINNKMSDDTQEYLKNVICNLTAQKESLQIERNKMEGELIKVREELATLTCHSGSAFRTPVTRALYNGTPGGKSSTLPNSLQQELSQELSYDDYLPSPLVGCSRFPSNDESSLESLETSIEDISLHLPNISIYSPAISDDVFTNKNVGKAKLELEKMCSIIKKLKSAVDSERENRLEAEKKIDELKKLNEELDGKNKENLDKLNKAESELERANLNLQVEKKRSYGLEESLSFSMLKHEDELKDILQEIPNINLETSDGKTGRTVTAVQVRSKLRELLALKQMSHRDSPDGRPKTNDNEIPLCASTPTTEYNAFRPKRFTQSRAPQSSTPRVASPIIRNIVDSSALHDASQNTTASSIVSPNLIAPFQEDNEFSMSPNYINPFQNDSQLVNSQKHGSLRSGSPAGGQLVKHGISQQSTSTGRFSLDSNLRKRCVVSQEDKRYASSLDDSVIKRERSSGNNNKDNGLVFTFDDMPDVCRTGSTNSFGTRSNLPTDEDQLKDMFDNVALAFRKDKRTLRQRLTTKEKDRNEAESAVDDNLKSLSSSIEGLENSLNSTTSKQVLSESLNSLCQQISFLKESTRQVSSNSTQFGCMQQEARMMSGVDVLINYGENISRKFEKISESLEKSQETSEQDFISLTAFDLSCQDSVESKNANNDTKPSVSSDKSLKNDSKVPAGQDQSLNCTKDATSSKNWENETNKSIELEKRPRFGVKRCLSWLFGLILLFLLIVVVIFCGAKYSVIDRDFVVHQLQVNLRRFEVKHFGHEPAV